MKYKAVKPPEWFAKGSIYQINPRTFSREGTLRAIIEALPELAELGFKVVYLCPIFEEDDSADPAFWSSRQKKSNTGNPKNPYRINNFFKIDPEYGSADDLRELISKSHELDMRVMLDLVYLHTGPNSPILKTHPEFACQDKNGKIKCSEWNFPHLDFNCGGLKEYLWSNMVYYISEFDADGFRCDSGDQVPLDFWEEGKRRIRLVKPDAVMLNEGSRWNYLLQAFDATYCFDWHETLYGIFSGKYTAEKLREGHESVALKAPYGMTAVRDIDNHDTVTDWSVRTELAAGHDGMEMIEVINYLIDGIPMVYAGNEIADAAKLSLFANRFYPGEYEFTDRSALTGKESLRRREIIKKLNQMKKSSDILCSGKTVWLDTTSPESVIAFKRTLGARQILFIGNTAASRLSCTVCSDFPLREASAVFESREKTEILPGGSLVLPPHGYFVMEI